MVASGSFGACWWMVCLVVSRLALVGLWCNGSSGVWTGSSGEILAGSSDTDAVPLLGGTFPS